MIHKIRNSRLSKIIASYLAIQMIVSIVQPNNMYALTGGPTQPEFNSFTPIGTSDMVNLSTGDFNYNIPIMDVGGYPLNLAYDSGVTMDQEASWVGLGWNLNVGQINRNVRGIPDDFDGDNMIYENNVKDNVSIGVNADVRFPLFGYDFLSLGIGIGVVYNNYNGISFNTSLGPSFDISDQVSIGMQLGGTSEGGASVSPRISLSSKNKTSMGNVESLTGNIGVTYDSQKGLSSFNVSASYNQSTTNFSNKTVAMLNHGNSISGNIPLNDYLTFTPKNELSFNNTNLSFSFALGGEIWGVEVQGQITAWGSIQQLRDPEKLKNISAYGYENTENALVGQSILDFNREKDRIVNENTKALAPTNYTYDSYMVAGQGLQGGFRPYRSQVGNLYDTYVSTTGDGAALGGELGLGAYVHFGLDIEVNPSTSTSGRWEVSTNPALSRFELDSENDAAYEPTYYKMSGDISSDGEYSDPNNNYYSDSPLRIGIGGGIFKRTTKLQYEGSGSSSVNRIKRNNREDRTNGIQKFTNAEAGKEGLISQRAENFVKAHHTAGISVLKDDGSRYIYGESAYNTKKVEATFAVSGNNSDCSTGIVSYENSDDGTSNSQGRDHFYNKVITPSYAHSYLLTSVLSKDYEDLQNDGPTMDDLGSYTKITYSATNDYKWRVPYGTKTASFNAGLNTDHQDQKGNYIYGEKEIKYVDKIETKTHVAIFHLNSRDDAKGVNGPEGSEGSGRMKKLDSIKLYTLTEYYINGVSGTTNINAIPIKTAHFDYAYTLCPGLPNSSEGKLTLNEVYFTYQNSKMGKYTPYRFYYKNNYTYNLKGYDIWGNYKKNIGSSTCDIVEGNLTPTEFPFVEQDKSLADLNATAWTLESIDLPSGGKLTVETESDDYQFVQNRKAMQMFKLVGAGNTNDPSPSQLEGNRLYDGNGPMKYIYVKLPDELPTGYSVNEFRRDYIKSNSGANGDIGYSDNNLMYFRVLTNMTKNIGLPDYDYVTGYLRLDSGIDIVELPQGNYAALPLVFQDKEGGLVGSNELVNPISKAGWYFARKYLNRQAYGLSASVDETNLASAAKALVSSIGSMLNIFGGPNQALKAKDIASTFVPEKSWIRLYEPSGFKFGGGIRVKKITLNDQWNIMVNKPGNDLYKNMYGQEYSYLTEEGKSSGVATFEPNGSKENPFVLPIFDDPVKVIAPKESNYIEKPLGESFFPAAQVTYSRVKVKNLNKDILDTQGNPTKTISKHATGEVVTTFYTSFDFPVIADYTDPAIEFDKTGVLGNFLKVRTRNHLTMSQGFVVHTNDMNGKMKSQRVKAEGQGEGEFISGVDYNYSVDGNGKLSNTLDLIDDDGAVHQELLGVNYDMINDFRMSKSKAEVLGADGNVAIIPTIFFGFPIPIPSIFPNLRRHETQLKMASTTKVVHTNGILLEKVAYDLGSRVSTENLGWSADTGEVLLTKVSNEYDENYYSFNYPSRWYYKNMGSASQNIGLKGKIILDSNEEHTVQDEFNPSNNIIGLLNLGDELAIEGQNDKYWIVSIIGSKIKLMDSDGDWGYINDSKFKITRSGKRNNLNASMASVTTQTIPFATSGGHLTNILPPAQWVGTNVVNSSAIEFSDFWDSQCEYGLPQMDILSLDGDQNITEIDPEKTYNPYVYNVLGEFRPVKSYAYLTGRNNGSQGYHPRKEGYMEEYMPFYGKDNVNAPWQINNTNWTAASEVTKYSPLGAELENKDALERYSAAIYDYAATMPIAVASNSKYEEIGYDNMESYTVEGGLKKQDHFSFAQAIAQNQNASIDPNESHTGKSSMRIEAGKSLTYIIDPAYGCDDCEPIQAVEDNCIVNGSTGNDRKRYILRNDELGNCLITSIEIENFTSGQVQLYNFSSPLDPNDQTAIDNIYIEHTGSADGYPLYSYTICTEDPSNCSTTQIVGCDE
ncbi:hypothetical protein [Aequorivita antarctica]|uniref:Acyloxyacyl hydrolase n=1 Tax=Aequorivita antarctica TaxID=153266 RepID=A0A5C6YZG8_9FLAO|nr:hypothetical protein [Aequorivita antarctica]TXD72817.1 acyloxyacyl hydrolase [Aequorivita antarctica]SRX75248.1 hypothetical protein AEQU3_02242 [Aequorivita antarctica]